MHDMCTITTRNALKKKNTKTTTEEDEEEEGEEEDDEPFSPLQTVSCLVLSGEYPTTDATRQCGPYRNWTQRHCDINTHLRERLKICERGHVSHEEWPKADT